MVTAEIGHCSQGRRNPKDEDKSVDAVASEGKHSMMKCWSNEVDSYNRTVDVEGKDTSTIEVEVEDSRRRRQGHVED